MARRLTFLALLLGALLVSGEDDDLSLVKGYVVSHGNETFRPATGLLPYPYLVPSGPYEQCWDWDSVFTGVGLLDLGGAPYLAGSMKNFFHWTNLSTGFVTQCVDSTTASPSCSSSNSSTAVDAHAKPLLIQGALFAATHTGDFEQFRAFRPQMVALLRYWERERRDGETGLYTWHDQMESGADNMVTSPCPSSRSECWVEGSDANTLASADVVVQVLREHRAFAAFLDAWGDADKKTTMGASLSPLSLSATWHRTRATAIAEALNKHLFDGDSGAFIAYNTSTRQPIFNPTYLLGVPLWAGDGVLSAERAASVAARLQEPDMLCDWGVRSTSALDPNYTNEDVIYPYSNWRGPVWVVAQAMLAYGLRDHGLEAAAGDLAGRVVAALARDIRETGTWHEAYTADGNATTGEGPGVGTGGPGFLSWNVLAYRLSDDLAAGVNPTWVPALSSPRGAASSLGAAPPGGHSSSAPAPGDVVFTLDGVPETWTAAGPVVGMLNPRQDATHEVRDMEFAAAVVDNRTSVATALTSASGYNENGTVLGDYDGFDLDVYVQHGDVLWPCALHPGDPSGTCRRLGAYSATGASYAVAAAYTTNQAGQPLFACQCSVNTGASKARQATVAAGGVLPPRLRDRN